MKTVKEIIDGLEIVNASTGLDAPVSGVCCDSRQAEKGSLFVSIPGNRADGHNYIDHAISRGAVAIVAQTGIPAGFPAAFVPIARHRHLLQCSEGYRPEHCHHRFPQIVAQREPFGSLRSFGPSGDNKN